jgi:hypothetical protein
VITPVGVRYTLADAPAPRVRLPVPRLIPSVTQMFEVLAFAVPGPACTNSAYCGPQEAAYRTTPASGDPYRYIQVRFLVLC